MSGVYRFNNMFSGKADDSSPVWDSRDNLLADHEDLALDIYDSFEGLGIQNWKPGANATKVVANCGNTDGGNALWKCRVQMKWMFSHRAQFNPNFTGWADGINQLQTNNQLATTEMDYMFYNTPKFTGTGLKTWATASELFVHTTIGMFAYSGLDETFEITNLKSYAFGYMFYGCKNLDGILAQWNLEVARTATNMFKNCIKFTGRQLDTWTVPEVTYPHSYDDFTGMFSNCSAFNANLSQWYIPKCQNPMNSSEFVKVRYEDLFQNSQQPSACPQNIEGCPPQ